MSDSGEKRILIDLDSLLDTRLGTLACIDVELARKAADLDYHDRLSDEMGVLFNDSSLTERFKEEYKKRGEQVLQASVCTRMVLFINEMTNAIETMMLDDPTITDLEVHVNTWPYDISKELTEEIVMAVDHYTSVKATVKAVSLSMEEQTVSRLKQVYSGFIVYDLDSWLNAHIEEFRETKIPTVSLYTPALFHNKVPTEQEIESLGIGDLSPFDAVRMSLAECIEVNFMPVSEFSLIRV